VHAKWLTSEVAWHLGCKLQQLLLMQIKHPALLACTINQGMLPIGDNAENSMEISACMPTADRALACTALQKSCSAAKSNLKTMQLHTCKRGFLSFTGKKLL